MPGGSMTEESIRDPLGGPWVRRDWLIATGLAVAAGVLFLTGLSVTTLGVTEGRWAEIARQMLRSGNCFQPVFNGEPYSQLYFDKPLLSYWAILPASWLAGGVSEWTTRLPSALAGIGAALAVHALGRRMFGHPAGVLAALLLVTSAMFVKWSRMASADLLNVLVVWLALWLWISGGREGRARQVLAIYPLLTVGCFLKGPVAAALFVAAAGLASAVETGLAWRQERWRAPALAAAFKAEFRWLISPGAFLGMGLAAVVFAGLLLLPVAMTTPAPSHSKVAITSQGKGDYNRLDDRWVSVKQMWRENVTRFVKPFDHKDKPFYFYVHDAPAFFAPWSLLLLAALWTARKRFADRADRTALCLAAGIFIFLTASGSRRDYYVLPLVPALALVTGRALALWIEAPDRGGWPARLALIATGAVAAAAPLVALAVGRRMGLLQPGIGLLVAAGAASALIAGALWLARTPGARLAVLVALVWCGELAYFTAGASLNEEGGTLRPFTRRVAEKLRDVPESRVAAYRSSSPRMLFYLDRGPIRILDTAGDLGDFRNREPEGYVLAKWKQFHPGKRERETPLEGMEPVIVQALDSEEEQDERLLLLRFPRTEAPCATCR